MLAAFEAEISGVMENTEKLRQESVGKTDRILLLVLAFSLIANVWLAFLWQQNRRLAIEYAKSSTQFQTLPAVGARVDELQLVKPDGEKLSISLESNALPIVVYVMSPTCGWCARNRASIDALATQLKGDRKSVV